MAAAPDPGASSIAVAVRVRPFTIREAAQLQKTDDGTLFLGDGSLAGAPTPKLNQRGLRSVIKVVDDRCLVFDPPEDNPVQKFSRSVVPMGKKVKDQVFAFDRIFDDNANQMDVYEGTTKGLLDSVLDGYNATVFAYGATGCGKTHTITGTAQQPGIIFLTMQELFEKIHERSDEKVTDLTLSYLEIYNETIRDLLVPGGSKQGLMLREDSNHAVTVAGLTSHHPKDVQEVMDMIVLGNEYRTVSPTEANAVSSRSHAVLQINVAQKDRNASVNEPHTMATLSIIDLAGSERASATKNRGERLLEGANINKSLLALGGCINALCDPRKKNHVPYRNSKLTRLLKFSLGGNCKTVMIVCVSPSSAHFDETQNTLRYANRAKNIQTKVTRNVFNVNRHVKDFLVKIDEQMALINELRAQQKDAERTFGVKARKLLDKRDATAREGIQRIRAAYDNAAPERQQKIADMRKLRCIERRIGTLSAWVAAFEHMQSGGSAAARDEAGEEAPRDLTQFLPPSILPLHKSAGGILAELEHSRHHLHQKIERCHWERPLDTALQHSIGQVTSAVAADNTGVADPSEAIATLTRETELLKANFAREAYLEVLEQEKAATTASGSCPDIVQNLLAVQFQLLASLSETLSMDKDTALARGQEMIQGLLQMGIAAATQVVKPPKTDASATASLESYPPSKRGTPKRKKKMSSLGPAPTSSASSIFSSSLATSASSVTSLSRPHRMSLASATLSPTKNSPRRRKSARKSVSFTPLKKKTTSFSSSTSSLKRSVRWRDDESEDGTLADFEKTPKKAAGGSVVAEASASVGEARDTRDTASKAAPHNTDAPSWAMDTVLEAQEPEAGKARLPQVAEEPDESPSSPELPRPMPLPSYLNQTDLADEESSADISSQSLLVAPEASSLDAPPRALSSGAPLTNKPSRFQAGFLSKTRVSAVGTGSSGSNGGNSSDGEPTQPSTSVPTARKLTPLRNISLPRASNSLTPPSATRIASLSGSTLRTGSPKMTGRGNGSSFGASFNGASGSPRAHRDENQPPLTMSLSSQSSSPDSNTSLSDVTDLVGELSMTSLDQQKLRSAIHSAKKAYRPSLSVGGGGSGAMSALSASAGAGSGNGSRRFSVGGGHHWASSSHSGPSTLASSTNGISRQRRRSSERRRSPPISCVPVEAGMGSTSGSGSGSGSGNGSSSLREGMAMRSTLTPGQARRMNMGGSLRLDNSGSGSSTNGSPRDAAAGKRRVTTSGAALGNAGLKRDAARPSVVWR